MSAPTPYLTYHLWGRGLSGEGIRGDIPLFNAHAVNVALEPSGDLRISVEGALRKKDGSQGRHRRYSLIDQQAMQPDWLEEIIEDADARFAVAVES